MDSRDLTISLTEPQRRFVDEQAAESGLGTAAEFVRHLIDQERDRRRESEGVRRELADTVEQIKREMGTGTTQYSARTAWRCPGR